MPRPRVVLGTTWAAALIALAALGAPGTSRAEEDACRLHQPIPIERLLRRLSIDLRGTVPDVAEYEAVAGLDELPDSVLDAFLASDEFRLEMRRYHEALLWTNSAPSLDSVGFSLSPETVAGNVIYSTFGRRAIYRGGNGTHRCQNKNQLTDPALGYDANGKPIAQDFGVEAGKPLRLEGWVEVHPYWEPDPSKTLKVCAFEAQTTASYTIPSGVDAGTHSCAHVTAQGKSDTCGCGPDLQNCIIRDPVQLAVHRAMREQILRTIDDSTTGGKPYSDIVTTKRAYYNGTLTHYFKHLGQQQQVSLLQNVWQESDGALPELAYVDANTWVPIERGGVHAGVLTLPAYLLRFQTNRGRANRYRVAFEGRYFEPPSTKDENCMPVGDDLTTRCVCRGCHTTLEPLASYFGQFVESGTTMLFDFADHFTTKTLCDRGQLPEFPSSAAWCSRYYVPVADLADPDLRNYRLKALQYADVEHPDVQPNFDAGPLALAQADIMKGLENGKEGAAGFHRVAVEHLFEHLMKRAPDLDVTSLTFEGDELAAVAAAFAQHDDLREAIRALVKLPAYRRAP